jgi:DNA-binding LacI/PurR family transcriptional regulator
MRKTKKNAKTTIIDIAKASGVSVSTVSRIINDKPDVSEETRKRVLAVIKEHRFAPQVSWQQLASGKSRCITLHYPQTPTRIHMMNSFVIGAAAACEKANYSLNVVVSPLDETSLLTFFRSGQTDGLILMEILMQDWRVELLRQNNFPFVMFGHCENNTGLSYVDFDIEAGIKMAMEHLVGLGHCQIGFVSAEPYLFTGTKTDSGYGHTHWSVKGYKDACKQYGLPVICERIQMATESVEERVLDLLAENPQLTAIITSQDIAVTGIIKAVQNRDLRIPEDISIVASAIEQMAELTTPPLTTINCQAEAASFQAAMLLIEQLEGNSDGERHILFPFELAVRGSTGNAPCPKFANENRK